MGVILREGQYCGAPLKLWCVVHHFKKTKVYHGSPSIDTICWSPRLVYGGDLRQVTSLMESKPKRLYFFTI